jgi:hypothetical protein
VIEYAKSKSPENLEATDRVFVIIDLDTNPHEADIRHEAEGTSMEVLFSNPCFEVWTLAHFQCTGEGFASCGAVLSRIKERWKQRFGTEFGGKAQADYGKLLDLIEAAIRCWQHRDKAQDQSWTEVWQATMAIIA